MKYLIEFNGKVASVSEHCRDLNISYDAVKFRHRKTGEPYEKCLEYYQKYGIRACTNAKPIEFNGKIACLSEHCKDLGINVSTVQSRHFSTGKPYPECLEYYQKNGVKSRANYRVKNKRLFIKWYSMKERCYNPNSSIYDKYGGKGIKVCDRWHDYINFETDMLESFLAHIEQYGYKDTTLDRIDYGGNYEPSNCRWATQKEQANNKSSNCMVTEDLNVAQFAEKYNLDYMLVFNRLKRGWSADKILNPPIEKTKFYLPCEALSQHCKENNYNYNTIYGYIHRYNLEPHEALAKYLEKGLDKVKKV